MTGIETGAFGAVALLILVVAALVVVLYLIPVRLWIAAFASGAYVGLFTLVGMRLRRVPPSTIVTARISAVKAGLDISVNDLEAHYLAGGNVVNVVNAMISAEKANIVMPFKRAAAIDLAGRDVLAAVKMSVIPKVIETPRIAEARSARRAATKAEKNPRRAEVEAGRPLQLTSKKNTALRPASSSIAYSAQSAVSDRGAGSKRSCVCRNL